MWIGGVRVIIFNEEGHLLLVRQHHEDRDIWMVPGGAVEEGENSREAAVREVKEETGLDISTGPLIWHIEEVSSERGQRFVNYFLAEIVSGTAVLGRDPEFDDQHQILREVKFVPRETIQRLPEKVYPDLLRNELWELADNGFKNNEVFKIRSSWK